MKRKLRIALMGGGLGGLTAALALARNGFERHVFEQASELREVGAGITLSRNATKVLRALGLEEELKTRGLRVGRDCGVRLDDRSTSVPRTAERFIRLSLRCSTRRYPPRRPAGYPRSRGEIGEPNSSRQPLRRRFVIRP